MNKTVKLSAGAVDALKALAVKGTATAKDLKDAGLENLNSAHLTALVNRGYVESHDVEVEVVTVVKRKVKAYTVTNAGLAYDTKEGK